MGSGVRHRALCGSCHLLRARLRRQEPRRAARRLLRLYEPVNQRVCTRADEFPGTGLTPRLYYLNVEIKLVKDALKKMRMHFDFHSVGFGR